MSIDFSVEQERLAALSDDVAKLLQRVDLATSEADAGRRAFIEAVEDLRDILSPEAAIAPPAPSNALAASGLAIVVGHSGVAQGAKALSPPFPANNPATVVDERHEYAWNTDLAMTIKALADAAGVRCGIFFRDGVGIVGAYSAVREWDPEATVELHFNAANGRARGSLVLYGKHESRAWAAALQKEFVRLYDRQGRTEDRGIAIPGNTPGLDRGRTSVTQLHPSALIEPFFGDSPSDAALGVARKDALARAILSAFAAFTGRPLQGAGGGAQPSGQQRGDLPTPPPPVAGDLPDVPLLREMIATYRNVTPAVQGLSADVVARLKGITLAQWIEESGWARSDLAARHFNFAGMKGIAEVDRILREAPATKVQYKAHDGVDTYLKFAGVRDFVNGYFLFLERSPYRGWKDMAARSSHDFIRFIGRKWAQKDGYASRVIGIERKLIAAGVLAPDGTLAAAAPDNGAGPRVGSDGTMPPPTTTRGLSHERLVAEGATAEFLELVAAFAAEPRFGPVLPVVIAQCGLESSWGKSDLAKVHANFAGIPWTDILAEVAAPVPHPTNPERGRFSRFLSPTSFVRAFLHRLDNDPAFTGWTGWTGSTGDAAAFAKFLARTWRPTDPGYADKIVSVAGRISAAVAAGGGVAEGGRVADVTSPAGTGSGTAVTGVVLQVRRLRADKRRGKTERTVGTYQLFRDGQPVAGVAGMVCESRGPGDNSVTGRQRGARIKAGTYPMLTHSGSRKIDGITAFKTFDFTGDAGTRKPPMPALRVGNTKARAGILIHPGSGWLWSIGCMNPSKDLADAASDMAYADSRTRVIALIEAIRNALGSSFPTGNNQDIPRFTLEVIGEPGPAGTGALASGDDLDADAYARAELAVAAATLAGEALAPPDVADLYDALASAMEAAARLGQPEDGSIGRVQAEGTDLSEVRSTTGANLWTPWALAIGAAAGLDGARRAPVLARLGAIADMLLAAKVPLDDGGAWHSAMTTAAIGNDVTAVEALAQRGAPVDDFDGSGVTPLLAAAFNGAPDAVRSLLARGADPSRTVRAPADEEAGDPEVPPEGADADACAAEGARLVADDAARLEDYEEVSALIWDALNPSRQ